jgi:tetratricopeptide (TPR) repeat protein
MKTRKFVEAVIVIVAVVLAAVAVPAVSAEANLIDVKAVEAQIAAAQGQVLAGNLDAALKALQEARAKAVTADLVARGAFVSKLVEVRLAERLSDQAKVLATLNEAFAQARQPDQIAAVWQMGLAMAQAAIADKGNAMPVVDFLAKGPGPAMKQFAVQVELAQLRMATGNPGDAEAELRTAAQRANSTQEWSTWVGAVTQLATAVDGGQVPQAGADVFARMRETAKPAAAAVDIAKGRFLLTRGLLDGVETLADQAVSGATSDDQVLSALSLNYDLALAFKAAGKGGQAEQALAKAEGLAQSRPVSVALAGLRGAALTAFGQPGKAAEVFWTAAQAIKTPPERAQMLTAFGAAMVASGQVGEITPKLQAVKASPAVYVAVANGAAAAGHTAQALGIVANIAPQAFVEDPAAAAGFGSLMQQVQARRQQMAKDQGARCRTVAAAFDAAAKASKDPKAAEALVKESAAMTALAAQVEK